LNTKIGLLVKEIENLKVQIRDLIEENGFLRSSEKSKSKSEMKAEIFEFKRLIGRLS
jgi:regulator of replication initiation timing